MISYQDLTEEERDLINNAFIPNIVNETTYVTYDAPMYQYYFRNKSELNQKEFNQIKERVIEFLTDNNFGKEDRGFQKLPEMEKLRKAGTIEKYWDKEHKSHEIGIVEYINSKKKEDAEFEKQNEAIDRKLKEIQDAIKPQQEHKTEYITHIHNPNNTQINTGDKIEAKQNIKSKNDKPFLKRISTILYVIAAIVTIWTFVDLTCNNTHKYQTTNNQQSSKDTTNNSRKTPK